MRLRMRPWLRKLHLWAGLAAAVPFMLTASTGVLVTWSQELAPVLDGPRWQVDTGKPALTWTQLLTTFRGHYPQGRITFMGEDRRGSQPLRAYLEHPESGFQDFLFDARTGQLRPRDQSQEWTKTLIQFHRNLLLGRIGRHIVAVSSLVALALSVIGLILWWPMRRGTFAVLRGRRLPLLRWHNLIGVLVFPMLVLFVATGVTRTYNDTILAALHRLAGTSSPASVSATSTAGQAPIADIVAAAQGAMPDAEITRFSESPDRNIARFRLRQPGGFHPAGGFEIEVDAGQAKVLAVRQPAAASWAAWYEQTWYVLHTGSFLGTGPRNIWALASLALAALGATGTWHWLRRRTGKRRQTAVR